MLLASRIALSGSFIALAVALGFLLAAVPNVELMTLTVFLAGAVLGAARGAFVGAASALVFSFMNPLGPPFPLVMAGQAAGMATAGAVGGVVSGRLVTWGRGRRLAGCAVLGFLVTLAYDALTNLGLGIHMGPIWPTLVGGLAFSLLHLASNTVVFVLLGSSALMLLDDLGRLGSSRPGGGGG
jgi:hypothetical protein